MNPYHLLLKAFRKGYTKLKKNQNHFINDKIITDVDNANDIIYKRLSKGTPCMIARYGSTELNSVVNYLGVKNPKHSALKFIRGNAPQWWWNKPGMEQMERWSGFFPATPDYLSRFGELMLEDSKELNILGSWLENEKFVKHLYNNIPLISLPRLEPYLSSKPWSRYLKGKSVVVVHPFAKTIASQYARRELLFENSDVLPEFKSMRIVRAVQSIGGVSNGFKEWFEALEWMKQELDKEPYDVALIGCGAYGFPLAAHSKRTGHQAIHLGGALQLLFGIRGKRWEEPGYPLSWGMLEGSYTNLFNEHWVKASSDETPSTADNVEGACYW